MDKRRKEVSQIVSGFKKVHGDKYDYSLVDYKGFKQKVCIICNKHGEFWQIGGKHRAGQGCPKCATEYTLKVRTSISMGLVEFLRRSAEKHGDRYGYSKVKFLNINAKVTITCPEHGDFLQSPRHHLKSNGCFKCGRKATGIKNRKPILKADFITVCENIQKTKYIYDLVPDVIPKGRFKVNIICPTHGVFQQLAESHMRGSGCNKCCYRGYDRDRYLDHCTERGYSKVVLYLIRVYNDKESFYKIGITCKTIKERFRNLKRMYGYSYEVVNYKLLKPDKAWDLELYIKLRYEGYKYKPKVKFGGSSECFQLKKL